MEFPAGMLNSLMFLITCGRTFILTYRIKLMVNLIVLIAHYRASRKL